MDKKLAIEHLKSIRLAYKRMLKQSELLKENDIIQIYTDDIKALDYAIGELEKDEVQ